MTLNEFCARYQLTAEKAEGLLRKMKLPMDTPIDPELEGILINLSDTRIPTYSPKRRSALSSSELEILLKYYELYVETDVFFRKEFYAFGKMLLELLKKTGRTLPIPADMVVELKKRLAANPNDQALAALKTLLVQFVRGGQGVASPIKAGQGLSFAESVFRSCPGKHLAILSQDPVLPQQVVQEAKNNHQYLVLFCLDNRGLMRVNRDAVLSQTQSAPAEKPPTLHVQTPPPAPTDAPAAPQSPVMTGAGTLRQDEPPAAYTSEAGAVYTSSSALLRSAPQPMEPPAAAGEASPAWPHRPTQAQSGVYPAYPVQNSAKLTPGAVPHPFPGPEVEPVKQPMHMEPFTPQRPAPSAAPLTEPVPMSPATQTAPETVPLTESVPAPQTAPAAAPAAAAASPIQEAAAVPEPPQPATAVDRPLPQGITLDEKGRRVKRGHLHKVPPRSVRNGHPQEHIGQPVLLDNSVDEVPNEQRRPTMRERFVQGIDTEPHMADEQGTENSMQKLSTALKALYVALAVLGLGIVGILIYQFLI